LREAQKNCTEASSLRLCVSVEASAIPEHIVAHMERLLVYAVVDGIELIKELLDQVVDRWFTAWQTADKLPNVSVGFFAPTMKELIDTAGRIAGVDTAHADRERRRLDVHQ
jgi:hypothetical protein